MSKEFIKQLMTEINKIRTCYYEEADKKAVFPYLVVPTIQINPLEAGYICLFDIEIYNNELSNVITEDICDELKNGLDRLSVKTNMLGFHLGFDSQYLMNSNEQDLIARRISFSARIFN